MRTFAGLIGAVLLCSGSAVSSQSAGPAVRVERTGTQPILRQIRATGNVSSPNAALLSASVEGLVAAYLVDVGDVVKKNDPLVKLDAELAEVRLQSARASEQEVRSALEDAQRRLAEAESLSGERGIIAATEVESRRTEVAAGRAALAAAEANVRLQEVILRRHVLYAPFAGVVSERPAEVGEWANPGDPLLELVATGSLQFDFRLPQGVFPDVGRDTIIEVSFDALPDTTLTAKVAAIVPVSDPNDRTFLLRATPASSYSAGDLTAITPGMSVRALITLPTGREGIVVPRDALLRYTDGRVVVWVVNSSGQETSVAERQVQTGLVFDGKVEINTGLNPGERVVVRGNEALSDGQAVVIRE